jgi:hypothetical protein
MVDLFVNVATVLSERSPGANDRLAFVGGGLGQHLGVLLLET